LVSKSRTPRLIASKNEKKSLNVLPIPKNLASMYDLNKSVIRQTSKAAGVARCDLVEKRKREARASAKEKRKT
jgi:hypothetical protein